MTKLPTNTPKKTEDPSDLASVIKELIGNHLEGKIEGDELLAVTAQITHIVTTTHYSGALPHPQHFKGYEDVLPGAAERILSMQKIPWHIQFQWNNNKSRFTNRKWNPE